MLCDGKKKIDRYGFMEDQVGWHGKAPNEEQRAEALKELEG